MWSLLNVKLQVGLSSFECARSTRLTEHCLGNDELDCLLLQKVCRFDLVSTAPCSLVQTSNDNVCWSILSCLRIFAGMGDGDTDGKN